MAEAQDARRGLRIDRRSGSPAHTRPSMRFSVRAARARGRRPAVDREIEELPVRQARHGPEPEQGAQVLNKVLGRFLFHNDQPSNQAPR